MPTYSSTANFDLSIEYFQFGLIGNHELLAGLLGVGGLVHHSHEGLDVDVEPQERLKAVHEPQLRRAVLLAGQQVARRDACEEASGLTLLLDDFDPDEIVGENEACILAEELDVNAQSLVGFQRLIGFF